MIVLQMWPVTALEAIQVPVSSSWTMNDAPTSDSWCYFVSMRQVGRRLSEIPSTPSATLHALHHKASFWSV